MSKIKSVGFTVRRFTLHKLISQMSVKAYFSTNFRGSPLFNDLSIFMTKITSASRIVGACAMMKVVLLFHQCRECLFDLPSLSFVSIEDVAHPVSASVD